MYLYFEYRFIDQVIRSFNKRRQYTVKSSDLLIAMVAFPLGSLAQKGIAQRVGLINGKREPGALGLFTRTVWRKSKCNGSDWNFMALKLFALQASKLGTFTCPNEKLVRNILDSNKPVNQYILIIFLCQFVIQYDLLEWAFNCYNLTIW